MLVGCSGDSAPLETEPPTALGEPVACLEASELIEAEMISDQHWRGRHAIYDYLVFVNEHDSEAEAAALVFEADQAEAEQAGTYSVTSALGAPSADRIVGEVATCLDAP